MVIYDFFVNSHGQGSYEPHIYKNFLRISRGKAPMNPIFMKFFANFQEQGSYKPHIYEIRFIIFELFVNFLGQAFYGHVILE